MLVAVVAAVVVLADDPDVTVGALPPRPAIAGSLRLDPPLPKAGQDVVVHLDLVADRPITPRALTVRAQDAGGTSYDFPELAGQALDTTARDITLRRAFPAPGVYTYYLAYRLDGDWVTLRPWETVTVR
ncbi:hypothetical protein CLV43_102323 [Umezawaea tangerina]|uniref:Uncharacterized protein n=1 Tax=Umezawaea tangerina TaxID=84725 RepID=A0A2T0TGL2_9PSEU|nr:hypothetical protein CLV43_102323 [Umezawaea tangerina]